MSGKKKCRILKEIRRKIADENDIPYVTHECRFQGECSGTCPKCESELRYLEKQLAARASAGKRVAIAALCAGMAFSAAGCSSPFTHGREPVEEGPDDILGGMTCPDEPESGNRPDTEKPAVDSEDGDDFELAGDVVYIEEPGPGH